MLFWTTLKLCLRSLLANKMRSILAMLGIIIGVGAVISMLALGGGARQQVMDRIQAMGSNLMYVWPQARSAKGVSYGARQKLTLEDALAVKNVPGVKQVCPVVNGNAQARYLNSNSRTRVTGSAVTYLPARNFEIEKGRAFTEGETDGMAHVAVLGPTTVENLFDDVEPVGQTIKLNGINFQVIGVTKAKGSQGWQNIDDQVVIPYTTAMKQLFGMQWLGEIDIQTDSTEALRPVQDAVTALLRKRHGTPAGEPEDFTLRNQADWIETQTQANDTFTYLLGGIAAISLLVGGIGIMNIMLVSVTERTREIGVRKAIGAKERNILFQFLIEAIIISGLGGLIGAAAGVGGAKVIASFSQFSTIVSVPSVILAISFSGIVGIFFGFWPAWRAARLDPVEALRYE